MIYIFSGNDTKKKKDYLKKLGEENQFIFLPDKNIIKEKLLEHNEEVSLFGEFSIIVVENLIKEGNINLSKDDLSLMSKSKTIFIFLEDKLSAADYKKYTKYSTIEEFNKKEVKAIEKTNIFGITDAYSIRDKVKTWVLYRDAVHSGVSPEEISGVIFWKIKTMILSGTKIFTDNELKINSSNLVSLYHKAHKGETDFIIGLEQFILTSLSK